MHHNVLLVQNLYIFKARCKSYLTQAQGGARSLIGPVWQIFAGPSWVPLRGEAPPDVCDKSPFVLSFVISSVANMQKHIEVEAWHQGSYTVALRDPVAHGYSITLIPTRLIRLRPPR